MDSNIPFLFSEKDYRCKEWGTSDLQWYHFKTLSCQTCQEYLCVSF